jgi:hypothetical protein
VPAALEFADALLRDEGCDEEAERIVIRSRGEASARLPKQSGAATARTER